MTRPRKGEFRCLANKLVRSIFLSWFLCEILPLFVHSQFTQSGSFGTPQSPCPQTFQYQSNGFEIYGVGQLQPGQYEIGGEIYMVAHLVVGTQLTSTFVGKIRFSGTPEEIVNKMYNNEPIQFDIQFPTQNPLPTISSILVNGNSICAADQFTQPSQGFFTRVTLQYMFKPIVSPNFRPRPSSPFEQRPNNILTVAPQKNNNPDITFTNQQPNFVRPQNVPSTGAGFNQQPSTESTINLVNQNNNIGFNLPASEAPPQAQNPTTRPRITSPGTTNYDVGCGRIPKPFTALIYGGTSLVKGDWPFIAALHHYAQSSLKFKCGATIISRTTIISAAHCFYNRRQRIGSEDILAFIGHFNLKRLQEEGSRIVNLASVIIHPDYRTKTELYSDIAVGKLTETIIFSEFIQPACLWSGSPDQSLIVGRKGVVAGWGLDESGMQTAEPKRVEVPVVSDQKCLRSHEGFGKITSDRTFCAGWRNGSEGPCAGDSGSGLMLNQDGMWYLRGLVSVSLKDSNTGSCDLNEFVVFTDVAKFVPWITSLL